MKMGRGLRGVASRFGRPGLRQGGMLPPAPNLLTNSRLLGAASGAPGTAPTGWLAPSALGTITVAPLDDGNSLRVATAAARHYFGQNVAVLASTIYVLSVYVDVTTTTQVQQAISIATLPAGATVAYRLNGAAAVGSTSLSAGSGHRLEAILTVGATPGTPSWRFGVGASSNATADLTFSRPKLEVGSVATAYVAT